MKSIPTTIKAPKTNSEKTSEKYLEHINIIATFNNWLYRISTPQQRLFGLVLISSAVCGLTAVLFDLAIQFIEHPLLSQMEKLTGWQQVIYTIALPTLGGLSTGLMLSYIIPEARGSGIPQVKIAYEVTNHIPLRMVIGKFLLGVLSIGTGASLGREGPTVYICSGLASNFGKIIKLSSKEKKNLFTIGSAAGVAAAFNAPIAGITFTLEELVGNFSSRVHLGTLVIASVTASIVERSILGTHPVFNVPSYGLNNYLELISYSLLGVLGGFLSLAFSQSLLHLRQFFQHLKIIPMWAQPAIGGFIVGLIALIVFRLVGIGGIAGIGYKTLSSILDANDLGLKVLLLLLIGKLIATVFCYASGGSGGIFSPVLFVGGMLGGIVGYLDQLFLYGDKSVPGAFALVGMSAVFAGVIRAPITAILIIFEMTGSYSIILPLMLASTISYLVVSHYQATPIYEALLKQDNISLPDDANLPSHLLTNLTVANAMNTSVVVLSANLSIRQALIEAKRFGHQAYPLLDAKKHLIGTVSTAKLKEAIASGQGKVKVELIAERVSVHLHPDHKLDLALVKIKKTQSYLLPIVNRLNTQELIGIITLEDIVHTQVQELEIKGETSSPYNF